MPTLPHRPIFRFFASGGIYSRLPQIVSWGVGGRRWGGGVWGGEAWGVASILFRAPRSTSFELGVPPVLNFNR